jgi:hypothetical protein
MCEETHHNACSIEVCLCLWMEILLTRILSQDQKKGVHMAPYDQDL